MDFTISTWVFLILLYWPWDSETRKYEAILKVPNGGRWGTWGEIILCPTGHVNSFALKVFYFCHPITLLVYEHVPPNTEWHNNLNKNYVGDKGRKKRTKG